LSPSRKQPAAVPASFEAAFTELQQVVEQLEDGGIDLERALVLFERGKQLAEACERLIAAAELRLTRLNPESADPAADT
jgi:exodeoxyribonuclease VII small subunit